MYWFPKSKVGRISFWVGISAFVLMYLQYWIAMLFNTSIPIPLGLLAIIGLIAAGIISVIALTKYKDRAILLFMPALAGLFGLLLVAGELFFPH